MKTSPVLLSLTILVLSACAAVAADAAPASPRLTGLFPQDTLVYLEVPSVPRVMEGAKGTGLYALWNDDAMLPVRRQWEELQARDGVPDGRAALLDFLAAVPGGAAAGYWRSQGSDEFLIVVESGPAEAQARAFLKSLLGIPAPGAETPPVSVAGVDVSVGPGNACAALVDGLTLAGTRNAIAFAIDRRKAHSADGSLSSSVSFTKSAAFFTDPQPAWRAVVDAPAVLALLRSAAAGAPFDVNRMLDAVGVSDVDTVSMEGSFRAAGVVERVHVSAASVESRLVALAGGAPLDEARLIVIPRTAVFAGARAVDFAASYDTLMEMIEVFRASGLDLRATLTNLEVRSSISIEKDVLPLLGGTQISWYEVPDKIDMAVIMQGGIEQVTLVEVRDEDAVRSVLDRLVLACQSDPAMLAPYAQPGGPSPEIATATLGTLKIYYLTAPGMVAPGPALAVSNGYLVYANGKDNVRKVVDRLIAPGPAITDSADFTRVRGLLSRPAQQVGYVNLDRIIDVAYESVMPLVSSKIDAARANGTLSIASADVPQSYVIRRHLDGAGVVATASGNLIDFELYSPSGIVGLAAAICAVARGGSIAPDIDVARGIIAPEPATPERRRLLDIGSALQLSTVELKGRFPESLTDVVPPDRLQAPQDAAADSPIDYVYVPGYTTSSPGRRILVYERDGLSENGRHVLFVDGNVEFLPEDKFRELLSLAKTGSKAADDGSQESGASGAQLP